MSSATGSWDSPNSRANRDTQGRRRNGRWRSKCETAKSAATGRDLAKTKIIGHEHLSKQAGNRAWRNDHEQICYRPNPSTSPPRCVKQSVKKPAKCSSVRVPKACQRELVCNVELLRRDCCSCFLKKVGGMRSGSCLPALWQCLFAGLPDMLTDSE